MGLILSSYFMTEELEHAICENPNVNVYHKNENIHMQDILPNTPYEYVGINNNIDKIYTTDNEWMNSSCSDIVMIHPLARKSASWVNISTKDTCVQYMDGVHIHVTYDKFPIGTHTIYVTSPDFSDSWICYYMNDSFNYMMSEWGFVKVHSRNTVLQSLSDSYRDIVMKSIEYVRCKISFTPSTQKKHVYVHIPPLSKGILGKYDHEHQIMNIESLSTVCSHDMLSELHELNMSFHMFVSENSAQFYKMLILN